MPEPENEAESKAKRESKIPEIQKGLQKIIKWETKCKYKSQEMKPIDKEQCKDTIPRVSPSLKKWEGAEAIA